MFKLFPDSSSVSACEPPGIGTSASTAGIESASRNPFHSRSPASDGEHFYRAAEMKSFTMKFSP